MRKFIIAFLFSLTSLYSLGQTNHIKFMGIPIDGTISTFEQKLISKGLKPIKDFNENSPSGDRYFNGVFAGYESVILVKYNPKTKIVYKVAVCIDRADYSYVQDLYAEFIDLLLRKYKDWNSGTDEGQTMCRWWNDDGDIGLVPNKQSNNLIIIYQDNANSDKNEESEISDL